MPACREYVHSNPELASKASWLARDFVVYDEAKSEAEAFESKLAPPVCARTG